MKFKILHGGSFFDIRYAAIALACNEYSTVVGWLCLCLEEG